MHLSFSMLCLLVAFYLMMGPRGDKGHSIPEKLGHPENQVRLLNICPKRALDHSKDK